MRGSGLIRRQGGQVGEINVGVAALALRARVRTDLASKRTGRNNVPQTRQVVEVASCLAVAQMTRREQKGSRGLLVRGEVV
jgi:hypothetical protein